MSHFVFLSFYFGAKIGRRRSAANSLVVCRLSLGRIILVLFWTEYAVRIPRQIKPGILKLTTSRGHRNWCPVFIFVSCEEKGCYCIVSLGHQSFDRRSYCGLSRRMQGCAWPLICWCKLSSDWNFKIVRNLPAIHGKKEGTIVLLNNAVNYIESGLEKGDNTKQCRDFCDVERTRAIGNFWHTREIDSQDYRTSRVEMCSRARSHMILSGDNKRNQTCFLCLEEKAQRKKVVDSLIFRKGFKLMWTAKLR